MSIFIITNVKGGTGKSFIASHFISNYILNKKKQKNVKLYEFDEYGRTSENFLLNSKAITSKVVSKNEMFNAMLDISFYHMTEDIIIDIGPKGILESFIYFAARIIFPYEKDIIFIIPYSNDGIVSLLYTIDKIQVNTKLPNIAIVLNKIPKKINSLEKAKTYAFEIYGNQEYALPSHPKKNELDKYIKGYFPDYSYEDILYPKLEKKSLVDYIDNPMVDNILNECKDFYTEIEKLEKQSKQ